MPVAAVHPYAFIRSGNHIPALATEDIPLPLGLKIRGRIAGGDLGQTVPSQDRIFKKNGLKIHFRVYERAVRYYRFNADGYPRMDKKDPGTLT